VAGGGGASCSGPVGGSARESRPRERGAPEGERMNGGNRGTGIRTEQNSGDEQLR